MAHQVSQKAASQQQVQQSSQHARDVETQEHHTSANASAGLNLNILGALSGALSSKSTKKTHQNPDGSSESVEHRHDQGSASGAAQGQGSAYAQGGAEERSLRTKERGVGQEASQAKAVEKKQVDHLGIEA